MEYEIEEKIIEKLPNEAFGVPELRRFPLHNEKYIIEAINTFHYCPIQYKRKLAENIYYSTNQFNIELNKDSPIYDYLPERLQENFNYEDFWEFNNINEDFNELLLEVFVNEIQAQEQVNSAIDCWRRRAKTIKTPADKTAFILEVRNEKTTICSLLNRGDYNGIIKKANTSKSVLINKIKRFDYGMKGQASAASNPLSKAGAGIASKATGAVHMGVGGTAAAVKGLSPALKVVGTLGAAAAGAKVGKKLSGNKGGLAKTRGAAVGALATGVLAASALKFNNKKAKDDENIRKHALKYVDFITKFEQEANNINVSATSGAIKSEKKK